VGFFRPATIRARCRAKKSKQYGVRALRRIRVSFVEAYLSKIGRESHDAMKVVLFELLRTRYRAVYDEEFAAKLAAAVANFLFCDGPKNDETGAQSFGAANEALIKSRAEELSTDDALCRALTCAVYNSCYGKYIESGGRVGLLLAPFLGYVRAL
jgi:hypothetical protein